MPIHRDPLNPKPWTLVPLEETVGAIRPVAFADHVKTSYCKEPDCPHVHLLLCTPDGRPYTMAVLSAEQLDAIAQLAWELRAKKRRP